MAQAKSRSPCGRNRLLSGRDAVGSGLAIGVVMRHSQTPTPSAFSAIGPRPEPDEGSRRNRARAAESADPVRLALAASSPFRGAAHAASFLDIVTNLRRKA